MYIIIIIILSVASGMLSVENSMELLNTVYTHNSVFTEPLSDTAEERHKPQGAPIREVMNWIFV